VSLLEVYLSAIVGRMIRDDYSQVIKILEADYEPESINDVIRICENFYVEEQQDITQKRRTSVNLFDGTLEEIKIELYSLQLIN
jgi:hypothetical protein